MDYLKTAKAPLEVLNAIDRIKLSPAQKNVLYGLVEIYFNSTENVTVKILSAYLNQYSPLTNRYLNDLICHRCIIRMRKRSGGMAFFLNDLKKWSDMPYPMK